MESLKIAICYEEPTEDASADLLDIEAQADFLSKSLSGHTVTRLPLTDDIPLFFARLKEADLAWNLFEIFHGREEKHPLGAALLEIARIRYTGNGFDTLGLLSDKRTVKAVLAAAGLPVPESYAGGPADGQWVVKPSKLHGSSGIGDCSVFPANRLPDILGAGNDLLAERYISGDEYSATLIDTGAAIRTVAVAQMRFEGYMADQPRILSFDAKWSQSSLAYRRTNRTFEIDGPVAAKITALADRVASAVNLNGFARIDFRLDRDVPLVIDVNPNPGLGDDSGFIAACKQAGIKNPLDCIIKAALK